MDDIDLDDLLDDVEEGLAADLSGGLGLATAPKATVTPSITKR